MKTIHKKVPLQIIKEEFSIEPPELRAARRLRATGVTENDLCELVSEIPSDHLIPVRNALRDLEKGFIK